MAINDIGLATGVDAGELGFGTGRMGRRYLPSRQTTIRRHARGVPGALGLVCVAVVLSACSGLSTPASGPMAAMASVSGDARTVAFESIDGPPPPVFERLVQVLDSELQLRNVAVVSRNAAAGYHVRGYLSAQLRRGRTIIAWVWDVYDRDQQRVLRLSGEEDGGKTAGRDAWAAADDGLLRRIAQTGLITLSGLVNGTAPQETPPGGRAGPAVASLGDDRPVALGYSAR